MGRNKKVSQYRLQVSAINIMNGRHGLVWEMGRTCADSRKLYFDR